MIARIAVAVLALSLSSAAFAQGKPKPATALVVANARAVPATTVSVEAGSKTVSLSKPLAPNGKATLKLPKMTGCMVSVSASFADESVVEQEVDVCKEKTLRFTE
jgi:hypothetical protein